MDWSWFFRDKHGQLAVLSPPNAPLIAWLAAVAAGHFTHGIVRTIISSFGTIAIIIWAILEIARGASPFRRALGLAVLIFVVASRFI